MKLIDKDALVAEIEKRINELREVVAELGNCESYECGVFHDICLYEDICSVINTLEVKEVDFEKEVDAEWNKCNPVDEGMGCEFATIAVEQFYCITKYFFELGLKTQKGE